MIWDWRKDSDELHFARHQTEKAEIQLAAYRDPDARVWRGYLFVNGTRKSDREFSTELEAKWWAQRMGTMAIEVGMTE